MDCGISKQPVNCLHAQRWRSRPAVAPTGRCTSSAAELASRPTPPALRLFQAECNKARKPPTRRSVTASAAVSASPTLPTEGSTQSKQDQSQAPTGNGHMSSNGSHSNKTPAHNAAAAAIASQIVQAESLALLEWPEVCQQVASFTATVEAAERALAAGLPMASSQQQAEQLLQETAEAQSAKLSLKGVLDLRGPLNAAVRDRVLHPVHLDGVASSLEVAAAVADRLSAGQGQEPLFPALQFLGRGIKNAVPELRSSIRHCIENGRLLDKASERLSSIRQQRRENSQTLGKSMNEWARKLANQGLSEEALVVIRRDRQCVPVKAGRQSQLPKGSVNLATSASGSTVYMEPQPVVALNNAEAMFRDQEHEEEEAILARLSQMVKAAKTSIERLMKAITALDIACARGAHATWLNGSRPVFLSPQEAAQSGCIQARAVYHPLLLEPSLDPLKEPPAPQAVDYDASYTIAPSSTAAADSMGRASWEPQQPKRQMYGKRGQPKGKTPCPVDLLVPAGVKVAAVTGPNTGGKTASLKAVGLTAVMAKAGLFIPTATPPTNPLATPFTSISAQQETQSAPQQADQHQSSHQMQAPQQQHELSAETQQHLSSQQQHDPSSEASQHESLQQPHAHAQQQHDSSSESHQHESPQQHQPSSTLQQYQSLPGGRKHHSPQQHQSSVTLQPQQHQSSVQQEQQQQQSPRLVFFDQVLADVGDSQSLQQSLSTFSGHIRRIRSILESTSPTTLVLLDEVGSGTDPAEGAALAEVLLARLADTACFTYATTHHAQLKDRPAKDARFVNASVEFDLASLKPTYRLLWGEGGLSNALAVAEGLGFDAKVVQRAREIAAKGQEQGNSAEKAEELQESLQQELQEIRDQIAANDAQRQTTEQTLAEVKAQAEPDVKKDNSAKKAREAEMQAALQTVQDELAWIVSEVKAENLGQAEVEQRLRQVAMAGDGIQDLRIELIRRQEADPNKQDSEMPQSPAPEKPWKPKVGSRVRVLRTGGQFGVIKEITEKGRLSVQLKNLNLEVSVEDVIPVREKPKWPKPPPAALKAQVDSQEKPSPEKSVARQEDPDIYIGQKTRYQLAKNTIDIRGKYVKEALAMVQEGLQSIPDDFIVYIVHGRGTGKLREVVHEYLTDNPQVESWELNYESMHGCTVVDRKVRPHK